jgi:hypothetical protein
MEIEQFRATKANATVPFFLMKENSPISQEYINKFYLDEVT